MRLLASVLLFISFAAVGQSGNINVHLKSGITIPTRYVYLYSGYGTSSYLKIHEKKGEKISITLVDHIEGPDEKGNYHYIIPVQRANMVWAERGFTSDRIELYHTDIVTGTMAATHKPKSILYSKDGGPLQNLKLKQLKKDLGDCPASMDYIKKGKRIGGAQIGIKVASLGLVVAGIATTISNTSVDNPGDPEESSGPDISPLIIVGAVGAWIPIFMESAKREKYVEALKAYK